MIVDLLPAYKHWGNGLGIGHDGNGILLQSIKDSTEEGFQVKIGIAESFSAGRLQQNIVCGEIAGPFLHAGKRILGHSDTVRISIPIFRHGDHGGEGEQIDKLVPDVW